LASCYGNLAYLQSQAGEQAAAGESFGKAITLWKALLTSEPDSRALQRELAKAYTNLSSAHEQFGKLGDATNSLKQAIAMLAKLSRLLGQHHRADPLTPSLSCSEIQCVCTRTKWMTPRRHQTSSGSRPPSRTPCQLMTVSVSLAFFVTLSRLLTMNQLF
jgi:tetratricopeptide (TPR) repeat protein